MTTAEKITRLRKGNNLTQEQLAEMMGVSRQTVQNWESGESLPTKENLSAIRDRFSLPLSSLYNDEYKKEKTGLKPGFSQPRDSRRPKGKTPWFNIVTLLLFVLMGAQISILSREIDNLKHNIDVINRERHELRTYIYNSLGSAPDRPKDYTYFNYTIIDYNRRKDEITLQLDVTPTDYSRTTTAKFVVDTAYGSYTADAVYGENMYTASITIDDSMDGRVYLHLTDGEKVRSVFLYNMTHIDKDFRMGYGYNGVAGIEDVKPENGRLNLSGARLDATIHYAVNETVPSLSVYPKYAEVEIYADDRLVAQLPFDQLNDVDYVQYAKGTPGYNPKITNRVKYSAFKNLGENGVIEDKSITENSVIKICLKVTDNYYRYTSGIVDYANK